MAVALIRRMRAPMLPSPDNLGGIRSAHYSGYGESVPALPTGMSVTQSSSELDARPEAYHHRVPDTGLRVGPEHVLEVGLKSHPLDHRNIIGRFQDHLVGLNPG